MPKMDVNHHSSDMNHDINRMEEGVDRNITSDNILIGTRRRKQQQRHNHSALVGSLLESGQRHQHLTTTSTDIIDNDLLDNNDIIRTSISSSIPGGAAIDLRHNNNSKQPAMRRGRRRKRKKVSTKKYKNYDNDDVDDDDDDCNSNIIISVFDPAFLCLFVRVATTLGFIFLIVFITYVRLFPQPKINSTSSIYDDDDTSSSAGGLWDNQHEDNSNMNAQLQQQQLKIIPIQEEAYNFQLSKNQQQQPKTLLIPTAAPTVPPLPVWNLSTYALDWDPYSVYDKIASLDESDLLRSNVPFWDEIHQLIQEFSNRYGGENSARAILDRGLTTFGSLEYNNNNLNGGTQQAAKRKMPPDLHQTACRIYNAVSTTTHDDKSHDDSIFLLSFGGYSVTSGRGNYFDQSYPLVLEKQLHAILSLLSKNTTHVQVRNAAIGGCPSFPYGWCLRNFLYSSTSPDVISWDFSMNEAGSGIDPAAGFEAYIRQYLSVPISNNKKQPPKLIVKDTHMAIERKSVLKYYYEYYRNKNGTAYFDPVIVHTEPAVRPFLNRIEQHRPVGFQNWRRFGSPIGAPGQSLHHPAVKEHEFISWLLCMHFLSAIQLVAFNIALTDDIGNEFPDSGFTLNCSERQLPQNISKSSSRRVEEQNNDNNVLLPPPVYEGAWNETEPWASILYGEPVHSLTDNSINNNDTSTIPWKMNPVYCRTTFEPIVNGTFSSDTIIVSGSMGEDLNIMLPKSNMYYNRGWVIDMSDEEKRAKRNLERFGGLGFIDSKKAFYGIVTSGTLQLLLPYEASTNDKPNNDSNSNNESVITRPQMNDTASNWFKSVVLCEVNEKRDTPNSCNTLNDVTFTVGGINVSAKNAASQQPIIENNATTELSNSSKSTAIPATMMYSMNASGTMYLGKKLCIYIRVPEDAKLTSRKEMRKNDPRFQNFIFPKEMVNAEKDNQIGLPITLSVHNKHIFKREQACSISHVVWEQNALA